MKRLDILARASKSVRQAGARTILTSLAISVGAFTIALAMAAGMGGRAYTDNIVKSSGDVQSITVYPKYEQAKTDQHTVLSEYGEVSDGVSDVKALTPSDVTRLKGLDGVQSVVPMLDVTTEYVQRNTDGKKLVAPVSVKADRSRVELVVGSLHDNMLQAGEVIIPEGYLESFGFANAEDAIGKQLNIAVAQRGSEADTPGDIQMFPLTIAAVDHKGDASPYYSESIRIAPEDSQRMYVYQRGEQASSEYYGVVVLAKDGTDILELRKQISTEGYTAYSLEDQRSELLDMVNIAQWGLTGFGALAVLASIFGIINTQYISVLERTQQIGLMKALGMRRRDVAKLFRYEAAWVGFLGGMIGVVLAFAVTLLNPIITSTLNLEPGTALLQMDFVSSAVLVVSLVVVAVASGYFPARKAAKLDPIEALRTE